MSNIPDNSEADFKIIIHHVATTQANKVEEKKEVEKAWHGMWVCFALSGFVFFAIYVPYLFRSHETSLKSSAAESYNDVYFKLDAVSKRLEEVEDPVKDFSTKLEKVKLLLKKVKNPPEFRAVIAGIEMINSPKTLVDLDKSKEQITQFVVGFPGPLYNPNLDPYLRRALDQLLDLSVFQYELRVPAYNHKKLDEISRLDGVNSWRPSTSGTGGGGGGVDPAVAYYRMENGQLVIYCWNGNHGPIGFRLIDSSFVDESAVKDFVKTWRNVRLDTSDFANNTPPRLVITLDNSSLEQYEISLFSISWDVYDARKVAKASDNSL